MNRLMLMVAVAGAALFSVVGTQSVNAQEVSQLGVSDFTRQPDHNLELAGVVKHSEKTIPVGSKVPLVRGNGYSYGVTSYGGSWRVSSPSGILENYSAGKAVVYVYDKKGKLIETYSFKAV